ncbi:GDSL family lipase [Chromobacterium phragmitis]|uniref:SGNH/GDSL hydrolase family protein n=1 Tax=Chromobacterium amazonense TaxID=1382803 RepID=UPI0021B823FF|nr:SGNH/GDSL hydrolase family protein [Chromobacterium amazonense]MBM2885071.1 GDSL family lipase [Chromobacterium amazonense]MDE1716108.1 SGNH/GDSL hydrolase family protein [Chromobacterium amazonense]
MPAIITGRLFSGPRHGQEIEERDLAQSHCSKLQQLRQVSNDPIKMDVVDGLEKKNIRTIEPLGNFHLAFKNAEVEEATSNQTPSDDFQSLLRERGIKRLVVIGDSLSDSDGRMCSKTMGLLPSSTAYYQGRFTNGFTWPEFLASPSFMDTTLVNMAEGGAVASRHSISPAFLFVSNMARQIKGVRFQESDIVFLALGSNDYMTFGKTNIAKVISTHDKNIKKLISAGVKHIIVVGVPDLSKTVYAHSQDRAPDYRPRMEELSTNHNIQLREKISQLQNEYASIGLFIRFFDIQARFEELTDLAKQTGYETTKNFCEGYINLKDWAKITSESKLNTDHHYIFHDQVHPSQEVHQILASRMFNFIRDELKKVWTT